MPGQSTLAESMRNNRNGMRHGLRSGRLPKGASYIKRDCDQFRRAVEDAVAERHGEFTVMHAAIIQTAMRWERHAQLAQRWLAKEAEQMSANDRLAYSRDIARASSERDRWLEKLGLDQPVQDFVRTLYVDSPDNAPHRPSAASDRTDPKEPLSSAPDAAEAKSGNATDDR